MSPSFLNGLTVVEWLDVNQHRIKQWRRRITHAGYALAAILALHAIWSLMDPWSFVSRRSVLKRTSGQRVLNPSDARLRVYTHPSTFSAPVTAPCEAVPERTTGDMTFSHGKHKFSLTNLFALNHRLIHHEHVSYAMPKMITSQPPNMCLLSILHTVTVNDTATMRIVDMVNPHEVELRPSERANMAHLSEYADFRDSLLRAKPLVTIESLPFLRVNYHGADNTLNVAQFEGVEAHSLRIALRLLQRGEPLSVWGVTDVTESVQREAPVQSHSDGMNEL